MKRDFDQKVIDATMSDKLKDECGVFGVFGHPEAANLTYLGLYALQHRGQEGAGIVSSDGSILRCPSTLCYLFYMYRVLPINRAK